MKNIISTIIVITLLATLAACGGTSGSSSESAAISSAPESALGTLASLPDDLQAVLNQELDEIQNAVEAIAPTHNMETSEEQEAMVKQVETIIAELGLPVRQYHNDMPNYEKITTFFDKVNAGENAFFSVYTVSAFGGLVISGDVFYKSKEGFFELYGVIYQNESLAWEREIQKATPLKSLELTANGNLLYYGNYEGAEGFGYRVVPQQKEYADAYWKYVWLVDVQADGVLTNSWNREAGFRDLPWGLIFEEIWERENGVTLVAEDNPYYHEIAYESWLGYAAIVPADVVEETLQKYFNVSAEDLRKMTDPYREGDEAVLYHPTDNTYRIWGFRGGGYKPTVEVWGITENADGSISLELAWVSLDFGNDGSVYSTLTVMPQSDGGFKYISNIYSEDTVKGIVERSLELTGSLEMIHQGGFETTGESVEKNGYRFAAVDIEKLYQGEMKLGGVSGTESIKRWFYVIFEEAAAEKYIRQIFDTPLYIDADKDGAETLYVNQDVKGARIAPGEWLMEGFTVMENTPERITVKMKLDTPDGKVNRELTLVPAARNNWLLTDSYEGNMG